MLLFPDAIPGISSAVHAPLQSLPPQALAICTSSPQQNICIVGSHTHHAQNVFDDDLNGKLFIVGHHTYATPLQSTNLLGVQRSGSRLMMQGADVVM
jgi:hypothetical protein